jgi:hypothetical protein
MNHIENSVKSKNQKISKIKEMNKKDYIQKYLDNDIDLVPVRLMAFDKGNGQIQKEVKPQPFKNIKYKDLSDFDKKGCNNFCIKTGKENNITVVDIDDKNILDETLKKLNITKEEAIMVETNKGYHLYFKYNSKIKTKADYNGIRGLDTRSDNGLILCPGVTYMDTKGNKYDYNTITNSDFDTFLEKIKNIDLEIPDSFLEKKDSPPVTPTTSDDEPILEIQIPKCSKEKLIELLYKIKPRYHYDDWTKIGFIIYNNFDGSDEGLEIYIEYTKKDENYSTEHSQRTSMYIMRKWDGLNSGDDRKLSYKTLEKWYKIDYPPQNKYEAWYNEGTLRENMNKELIYIKYDSTYIYKETEEKHFRWNYGQALGYYNKFSFDTIVEEETYNKNNELVIKKKKITIKPFILFNEKNINRNDVDNIVFNPETLDDNENYNLWRGFKYDNTIDYDMNNIQHFLDHIKNIICNGNIEFYEYTINWFSRIIQTPHLKNKVGLVWYSEAEGVGKNVVLDVISELMGNEYYYSTSNLEHLLGNFNGDAEGKILINLNECTWGGDKKKEGRLKELVTENQITINQKGIKTYSVDNYCNLVVTSNNDWILGINKNDRRWAMITCSNEKFNQQYYKDLYNTNRQELFNFFYDRDIDNYDPTNVIKTQLHQEQVDQNIDTVEQYWKNCLETNRLCDGYKIHNRLQLKKKDIFDDYYSYNFGTHAAKVGNIMFWKKIRKLTDLLSYNKKTSTVKFTTGIPELMNEYNNYCKYEVFTTEDMENIEEDSDDECEIEVVG